MNNVKQPTNAVGALVVMILFGVGGAWFVGNLMKAANEVIQTPSNPIQQGYQPTPRNPSQAIDVTDEDLYGAYDNNEVSFNQQYVGKTVNVTGTIYKISDDSIWLQSSSICFLSADQTGKLVQLSKGQTVTVQGVVEKAFVGFRIADCSVIRP